MKICVWGDSIAEGSHDSSSGGWVERLRKHIGAIGKDIDIYNLSVSGSATTDLLDRIGHELEEHTPDSIVFAIGTNDAQFIHSNSSFRISPDQFQQNLVRLLRVAKEFTNKVTFIGLTQVDESKTNPIPWDTDKSYINENIKRLDNVIKNFCADNKLKFISMDGVIKEDDLADGLHSNSQGHAKIFNRIKSELELYPR